MKLLLKLIGGLALATLISGLAAYLAMFSVPELKADNILAQHSAPIAWFSQSGTNAFRLSADAIPEIQVGTNVYLATNGITLPLTNGKVYTVRYGILTVN
jgi:hypothetical protein